MKTFTVILIAVLLFSCNKSETSQKTPTIIGKWYMDKYEDWLTVNGITTKDSTTLDPLAILAEFKADSTIFVQERYGTVYRNETQRFKIRGNLLYWTRYWNPTIIDTFQIITFNNSKLSIYMKAISSSGMIQKWETWVKK